MAGGYTTAWGANIPSRVTVYDTTCSCSTPSNRIFNCKFLLRRISQLATPRRSRQRTNPVIYRKVARAIINAYLDSTGYFHPRWDTSSSGVITLFPETRSVIGGERIITLRPPPPDSLNPNPAPVYPQPFDASDVRERADEIGRLYTGNGYPFITVTTDIQPTDRPDTIELLFHVDPDELYRFTLPQLSGSFSTKRTLILRDLSIKPDSLFDDRAIDQSLQRLQARTYISSASAFPPLIASPGDTSTGTSRRIIVPFVISDRSGMGLDGAAGVEIGTGDRPRFYGNVLFSFVNLFHSGEEARLSYTGDRARQRLDLGYAQPWFFGLPLIVTTGGGLEVVSESYGYLFGNLGLFYEPAIRWHAGVNLIGHTVSKNVNAAGENGSFAGADLVLARRPEPYRDGTWSRELIISTGSGLVRKNRMYNRSHIDFTAGGHLPLPFHTAILLRACSGHIITREGNLVASEKYRVGGSASLRGYVEDEFAFRTVIYGQSEYLYYFQPKAPVYLFFDGGIGFENDIGPGRQYRKMGGYGIGIRLPAVIGALSIEWARNIQDTRSLGRIHVGFKNSFSSTTNGGFSFTRK